MTVVSPALDIPSLIRDGHHWINGQWTASDCHDTIDVIDPSNRVVLARVARGNARDVDAAVQAASAAQTDWVDMSPTRRGQLMTRWAELCASRRELDVLERTEVGRPPTEAIRFAPTIAYFAGLADKITGLSLPTVGREMLGLTVREPHGVCAVVIPWNGPGSSLALSAGPALAAGNTIVVKPAENAPLGTLLIARLASEAGIPPGVVNVVTGLGDEAGQELCLHQGVRHISFTGSPETGRRVMAAAATHLIPVKLELGGKSPHIVMCDAPMDRAVKTIVRKITRNVGQSCSAGSRVVVDERVRAEVVDRLATALSKITVGPWRDEPDMGPLISAAQEQRVLSYIDIGLQEGARLVVGGHKLEDGNLADGFFVEPTLFDEVRPSMRIAEEEIFGPVLCVIGYASESEAIEIANGTRYGLAATVWTRDLGRAVRFARKVDAGRVVVNNALTEGVIGAPTAGYKDSGFGLGSSADSVLEYTRVKTVVLNGLDDGSSD